MANVSSSNGLEKRPKLRFPGFDEPWKAEKLSDFAERVTRKNTNNETSLPLTISSKDGLVDQISYFNKTVASKDMSGYYLLKNGEYAYNKSYSVGYDFGSVKRLDRYDMGALSTLYICFALKKHDSDFINAYFDSLKWYREIYMISAEGARNHGLLNVPTDEFFGTKHYIPQDLAEQRKIAYFMIALEHRIEAQQSLVDNLKKYKRGLLSNAFRNASSWRKKRLGEICCIRTGKLDANAMINDGKYPFFTCARERYSIDTYAFDTDALLISGNGANVGYIHHYTGKFNAYQRTYVLDQFQEDINYVHVFLNRFLSSRIDAEKKAGNTPYIVLSTLSDMEIYIPDETTTKQLVDLFTQIENRISYSATVLEYLSSQRRGLLQQLFI